MIEQISHIATMMNGTIDHREIETVIVVMTAVTSIVDTKLNGTILDPYFSFSCTVFA